MGLRSMSRIDIGCESRCIFCAGDEQGIDILPMTLTLIVRTLSRLIYKIAFCGQILCDLKEFLSKFSLIIVVSNVTKRKEIKKTIIGISTF